LRNEIGHLLRQSGAKVLEHTLDSLVGKDWDLAVVDCDAVAMRELRTTAPAQNWRAERMFGLAAINLGIKERQALRRHFHMLLSRPVHHRTLLDLLVKASEGLSGHTTPSPILAKGLRVLVVEDEPVLQRLLGASLTTLGCLCDFAPNGRVCVEALGTGSYDVVFMDAHMPEMDGLTAVKQIRAGEAGAQNRSLWITTITADHRPEMRDMALAAGGDDYLVKPIGLTEIEIALQRFLRARRTVGDLVKA
jgi:CheY-like chemotaxis protein